jgi:hypothetical protein
MAKNMEKTNNQVVIRVDDIDNYLPDFFYPEDLYEPFD